MAGQPARLQGLSAEEEAVVQALLAALRRIQHGSVQLVVQDSRVVQINTVEKTRLTSGSARPTT